MLGEDPPRTQLGAEGLVERVDGIVVNYVLLYRVFDQYEIDIEITKHRHSYLNTGK